MIRATLSLALLAFANCAFAQDAPKKDVGVPLLPPDNKAQRPTIFGNSLWIGPLQLSPTTPDAIRNGVAQPSPGVVAKALTPLTDAERQQLRELAQMPHFARTASIQYSLAEVPNWGEQPDLGKQIADLEKGLKGDASDAESLLELGFLYDGKDQRKQAMTKAAEMFRKRVESEPKNGWLHAQLAEALQELGPGSISGNKSGSLMAPVGIF